MFWPLMDDTITMSDRKELVDFILKTDRFTNGPKVKEFEQLWSEWLGCKHTLFVSSGSTANFLLIDAWKEMYLWNENSKIIVPACTWMTNVAPIIQLGMQPIFCDIDPETFTFDIDALKEIREQEEFISGIFVTHLLGLNGAVEACQEIFPEAIVFEDVCESHGVRAPDGSKRGSNSIGATFSTYFGHHMSTIEGGMVCTNDEYLYDYMKRKRSHGMAREGVNPDPSDPNFWFTTLGYNFRNTELGAVLGINQLKRLDDMIDTRRENYAAFLDMLDDQKFLLPAADPGNSSFCLPFVCLERETKSKLIEAFDENEIEYRPIIAGNLTNHPAFAKWYGIYPGADMVHHNGLYIGNSHFVTDSHLDKLQSILDTL